ncbi:hypothetical protein [uncultured Solobacterium sp.]|uniref:hypothetical protein n=1 Tax=uncultured Solobacterium sp. TaxID=747375 RepID=UPI002611861A|nr:hypothetical protein [uncultured Solobacterium sp.]
MRKIFTFLSVLFIAVTVYIAYGAVQSAQQFEQDSIQRAHKANELSQQIADAQALQQETSSEEYSKLETMFNAGNGIAQAQTQALQDQSDVVSSQLQTLMQTYINAGDNGNFLSVWYPVDGSYTWSFAPTFIFSGTSQKVIWTLSDGTNMLAWVQGDYDASANRFSNLVLNYSQYGDSSGRELKGSSVEAWY